MPATKRTEKPTIRIAPEVYATVKARAEKEGSSVSALAEAALAAPGFVRAAEKNGAFARLTDVQRARVEDVRAELQARAARKAEKKGLAAAEVSDADALEWVIRRAWNRIHTLNAYYCDACGTTQRCAKHAAKGESSKLGDEDF